MTPEEYAAVVKEIEVTAGKNASDYLKGRDLADILNIIEDPDRFERYRPANKGVLHVCACGEKYYIQTPYEKCNPNSRDLCDFCIDKLTDYSALHHIPYPDSYPLKPSYIGSCCSEDSGVQP
jgi:hypothetical protein